LEATRVSGWRIHPGISTWTRFIEHSIQLFKFKEDTMQIRRIGTLVSLFTALTILAVPAFSQTAKLCHSVGGTFMTDLAVVDQSTTLGSATGDLKGAVTAAILNVSQNPDGTVSFTVQHHLVTDAGDTISFDQATAVTMPLTKSLFAVLDYPVHINGGTGKYAKATGDLNSIGEVDLSTGRSVFRYFGKVCFAQGGNF
jgi:hypothetical protein